MPSVAAAAAAPSAVPAAVPSAAPAADPSAFNAALTAAAGAGAAAPAAAAAADRDGTVTLQEMITLRVAGGLPATVPPAAAAGPPAPAGGLPDGMPAGAWASPVVRAASDYLGVPYLWGGTDPEVGLDCSGLVQRVFADLGVQVPRVAGDQSRVGQPVAGLADARPGDLLYYGGPDNRSEHIAIYLGEGRMLHAPRTGLDVMVDDIRSSPPDRIRRVL